MLTEYFIITCTDIFTILLIPIRRGLKAKQIPLNGKCLEFIILEFFNSENLLALSYQHFD